MSDARALAIAATAATVVRLVRELGPVLLEDDAMIEAALLEIDWAAMIPVHPTGEVRPGLVAAVLLGFADTAPDPFADLVEMET